MQIRFKIIPKAIANNLELITFLFYLIINFFNNPVIYNL